MNPRILSSVEEFISNQTIPSNLDLFAGAGLIVSDDPQRNRSAEDVFVLSPQARQISWVIYQMKSVFSDEIDYRNKLTFYPSLGRAANRAIADRLTDSEVLRAIVAEAKNFWSNRPLT